MVKSVSESARRHAHALSYIPEQGALLAGDAAEIRLGRLLAEGGEGKVYAIEDRSDLVAKIYKDYDLSRREKLQTMLSRSTRGLRKISAWPVFTLQDSTDVTVGFAMQSLIGYQSLHNAYQIRSRLRLFPHHTYAFL